MDGNLTKLTIFQVGDSDQKLADGISLFSVVSETYGKASIIGPLITVWTQNFYLFDTFFLVFVFLKFIYIYSSIIRACYFMLLTISFIMLLPFIICFLGTWERREVHYFHSN